MKFEWDLNKAESNLKKHGISFDEAKSIFYDLLSAKKRGQVFTFASSLTLFDKVKDTHFIKKGVRSLLLHSHLRKEKDIHSV